MPPRARGRILFASGSCCGVCLQRARFVRMTWPGVGRLLRERPCSASLLRKELQYVVQTPESTLPNTLAGVSEPLSQTVQALRGAWRWGRKRKIAHVCDLLRARKVNRDMALRFPSSGACNFS